MKYVLLTICWITFFLFPQLNAIIPECETLAEGSAEPEGGNEDLSTIDYNTLNVLREESQTTETQEAAPQEVSEELISTCVTPTRVKTIQRVLAQQDAKRDLCALRLLTHFFTKEELADSNTDGSHDKRGLDSGKLNSLKILVFSKFPASNSEEKAKAWRVIKVSSCPQIFKVARFYSTFIIISLMCAFWSKNSFVSPADDLGISIIIFSIYFVW